MRSPMSNAVFGSILINGGLAARGIDWGLDIFVNDASSEVLRDS